MPSKIKNKITIEVIMQDLKKKVIEKLSEQVDTTLDDNSRKSVQTLTNLLSVLLSEPEYLVRDRYLKDNQLRLHKVDKGK